METALLILSFAVVAVFLGVLYVIRGVHKDMKEIATEAILASRAHSAEELAQASAHAHMMKQERESPSVRPASGAAGVPHDPDKVQLADGTVLNVLKPFG